MESRVSTLLRPYLSLFLLVPESQGLKMDELKSMVQEVNDTELDREEILSYSVYYYNRELDCILEEDL